jgi:hypothetical protein
MSLTKLSPAWKNLIIPGQEKFWLVTSRLGTGKSLTFFTVYCRKRAANHKALAALVAERISLKEQKLCITIVPAFFSFSLSSLCVAGSMLPVFFNERSLSKGNNNIWPALTLFFLSFYFVLSHISTFSSVGGGGGRGSGKLVFSTSLM